MSKSCSHCSSNPTEQEIIQGLCETMCILIDQNWRHLPVIGMIRRIAVAKQHWWGLVESASTP